VVTTGERGVGGFLSVGCVAALRQAVKIEMKTGDHSLVAARTLST
jgi:hypothetical protein